MTDAYIEQVATRERAVARQHLDWMLDRWRLELGQVEVIPRDDAPITRTLRTRHLLTDADRARNPRFLPFFDGTGVLIRDPEEVAR